MSFLIISAKGSHQQALKMLRITCNCLVLKLLLFLSFGPLFFLNFGFCQINHECEYITMNFEHE